MEDDPRNRNWPRNKYSTEVAVRRGTTTYMEEGSRNRNWPRNKNSIEVVVRIVGTQMFMEDGPGNRNCPRNEDSNIYRSYSSGGSAHGSWLWTIQPSGSTAVNIFFLRTISFDQLSAMPFLCFPSNSQLQRPQTKLVQSYSQGKCICECIWHAPEKKIKKIRMTDVAKNDQTILLKIVVLTVYPFAKKKKKKKATMKNANTRAIPKIMHV